MVTTVKLQNAFEYSWWVAPIAAVFLIGALVLLLYIGRKVYKLLDNHIRKISPYIKVHMSPQVLAGMKNQYIGRIQRLLNEYQAGVFDKREGYQQLSAIIRSFVHEATGINVETLTAAEVKRMGILKLDKLMEEYYVPEFAEDERGKDKDLLSSCNTAMGVIKSWS
ncbi:MAG: hypothetical protein K6E91_05355 [Butyrivibrio sp.]|nr:hypothetical protein [Butyrivibrio sp.]